MIWIISYTCCLKYIPGLKYSGQDSILMAQVSILFQHMVFYITIVILTVTGLLPEYKTPIVVMKYKSRPEYYRSVIYSNGTSAQISTPCIAHSCKYLITSLT